MQKKRIITGASGLVGQALVQHWHHKNIPLILIGRNKEKLQNLFSFPVEIYSWKELQDLKAETIDTIVNLAGASVAEGRWSEIQKKEILDSRINATKDVVSFCKKNSAIRLLNASAIGIYGKYPGEGPCTFSEMDLKKREGKSFLQIICDEWEKAAEGAIRNGNRVVYLRTGLVLSPNGGALKKMLAPYKLGLGGKLGNGKQIISWIALEDLISIIDFVVEHGNIGGPINCVSPGACTQEEFSQSLAKVLGRPHVLSTPTFVLKMLLGEMADELLLQGQKVFPKNISDKGFTFSNVEIKKTLSKMVSSLS